jgi:uncharacterized protein
LGALLIIAGLGADRANAQSFDCRNARYADERTICQNQGLGQLDQELASAYDRVMRKLPKEERDAFDNNETAFVTARRRCGEHRACIEQSYRNRIQELQATSREEPGRHADPRHLDRQNASNRDGGKSEDRRARTEDERGEPGDGKHDTAEAAIPAPGRQTEQSETNSAAALPPPSPTNKRSRHKEPGTTVSAIRGPPSEGEGQAATGDTAVSEKRSRAKETAGSGSAIPNPASRHEEPGAMAGTAVPEKGSRHKERASTISALPAAPSEPERQPASAASGVPERHSEKRHSKPKANATGTPAQPGQDPASARSTSGSGGTQWVNPSPSP